MGHEYKVGDILEQRDNKGHFIVIKEIKNVEIADKTITYYLCTEYEEGVSEFCRVRTWIRDKRVKRNYTYTDKVINEKLHEALERALKS